ncbi:pantoate--beta-alanine ligase [Listeria grayi]|uniref:pantoate--beta-alanine ligase n=1 Tax=Listeria grayi TaxID=1641 RepID=UPI0016281CE4|nr:pantoate--beta-alanine ligase [Listeria grayi]MBC1922362.1 pantoate--beta-alanine ligase [Listeria grayi]
MEVIRTREALAAHIAKWKKQDKAIGFVPTMGYLHEGHMQLVKRAKAENDCVVMSVFVNPTQFGPNEDFDAYPRDEARDIATAEENHVDLLFMPSAEELYPEPLSMKLHVERRVAVLDGAERAGHFDGVVTVLMKLFHLMSPNRAYFGQKDAQQVAVVEGFVRDYFFPLTIVVVPTVREADGLAKSSRNVYLSKKERSEAPIIHQALLLGRQLIESGETNESVIVQAMTDKINSQKSHEKIAYLAIYSYPEFEAVHDWQAPLIIAAAVKYSKARLIDNELINKEEAIAHV